MPSRGNDLWLVSRHNDEPDAEQQCISSKTVLSHALLTIYMFDFSIPNLAANITLLSAYGVCALLQLGLGTYFKTWTFLVAVSGGCIVECIGYASRIAEHYNVWNDAAFKIQLVCLIIAPSFIAAGIYLSFKHIVAYMGPEASRIPPRLYTWIFICFDILSLVVQAAGGAMAASAEDGSEELQIGNDLILAGIGIQVGTMSICGVLALDFFIRHSRMKKRRNATEQMDNKPTQGFSHRRFQIFVAAEILAFVFILTRCIYRLPEFAGGWGNPLMRHETEFLILDGVMVLLGVIAFTVFHPGFWFPPMSGRWMNGRKAQHGMNMALSERDDISLSDRKSATGTAED